MVEISVLKKNGNVLILESSGESLQTSTTVSVIRLKIKKDHIAYTNQNPFQIL